MVIELSSCLRVYCASLAADRPYLRASMVGTGSNLTSTRPMVSPGAASNFHLLTASTADSISKGGPPTTLVLFTLPSGATRTSILTVPPIFSRRASSGYCGATLVFTLRAVSCCSARLETAQTGANRASSNNTPQQRSVDASDTNPPGTSEPFWCTVRATCQLPLCTLLSR